MPDPTSDLIGATEAARIIGCDKTTLTRAVADDRIAYAHKLPGKNGAFIFDRAEVDRFRTEYVASLEPVPARPAPSSEGVES